MGQYLHSKCHLCQYDTTSTISLAPGCESSFLLATRIQRFTVVNSRQEPFPSVIRRRSPAEAGGEWKAYSQGPHHRQRPLLRDSEPSSAAPPPLPLRPGDGPRGRSPVPGEPRRPPGAAESAPPGPTRRQRKWRRPTAASTPRARHGAAHVGLPFPTAPPSLPLLFPPPSRRVAAPPCATHGTAAGGGGSSFVRIEHQRAPCVFALPPSLHPTSRGHGAAREPVQESEAEQQGAELGERAGSWACGGVGRGEEERRETWPRLRGDVAARLGAAVPRSGRDGESRARAGPLPERPRAPSGGIAAVSPLESTVLPWGARAASVEGLGVSSPPPSPPALFFQRCGKRQS